MTAPIPNVIGIVIGIPVTLIGNHPIQNMLYGLKGTDLISLAVSVILLLGIAILAGYFLAQRVSRVDPMIALNCHVIAESLIEQTSYFVFRVDHGLHGSWAERGDNLLFADHPTRTPKALIMRLDE